MPKKQNQHPILYPCGQTRREFTWEMGGGFAGTALTWLLAQEGFFSSNAHAEEKNAMAHHSLRESHTSRPRRRAASS